MLTSLGFVIPIFHFISFFRYFVLDLEAWGFLLSKHSWKAGTYIQSFKHSMVIILLLLTQNISLNFW